MSISFSAGLQFQTIHHYGFGITHCPHFTVQPFPTLTRYGMSWYIFAVVHSVYIAGLSIFYSEPINLLLRFPGLLLQVRSLHCHDYTLNARINSFVCRSQSSNSLSASASLRVDSASAASAALSAAPEEAR